MLSARKARALSSGGDGRRAECPREFLSQVSLVLVVALTVSPTTGAETAQRDLAGQSSGLEFLHLGHFGPLSRLASHPTFAPLGLTPRQSVGFVHVLLRNGLLNGGALGLPGGGTLLGGGHPGGFLPFLGPSLHPVDPYFLYLLTDRPRYLPHGLGPQGIYGSTGLPRPTPPGLFRYGDKN